ncbi:MAG: dTMP kinase [Gemmataceae bacterium]
MTGRFFCLEGLDGTGKTTQCRLLAEWLRERGHQVIQAVDPGGTPVGQEIRHLLLTSRHHLTPTCEALLFMASRAQLVEQVVRPALDAGHIVLCDRFITSTLVYQGYAGGLDVEQLRAVTQFVVPERFLPQRIYLLDLPIEDARVRRNRQADRIEQRGPDYHEKVRQGFLAEARRDPNRFCVVDAHGSIAAVQQRLRSDLAEWLR